MPTAATRRAPFAVAAVEQRELVARRLPHHVEQVVRLLGQRGDPGVRGEDCPARRAGSRALSTRFAARRQAVYAEAHEQDQGLQDASCATLQIGLVRYQEWAAKTGAKAVVVFEGRDGAGKDGTIARITEHLTARRTRVVALPKPSDRERTEWYFQRYVHYLPAAGELVHLQPLLVQPRRRRAGDGLLHAARARGLPARRARPSSSMLEEADIRLVKLWLDISKKEQAERLDARRDDPLKALKVSDLDGDAQKKLEGLFQGPRRDADAHPHRRSRPGSCVHTDHKKEARLNIIRHLLPRPGARTRSRHDVPPPDPDVLYRFEESALTDGRLEK